LTGSSDPGPAQEASMRSLNDLQQEMRTAYLDGAPGMLV
jgi:hypothetical protein